MIRKVEAQINYNYNDHIMDNFSLRPVPMIHDMATHSMKANPSAMQVTRRTLNSRMAITSEWDQTQLIAGVDSQRNTHAGGMTSTNMNMPLTPDMKFQSYGAFGELSHELNDNHKLVTGVRVDQVDIDALKLVKAVRKSCRVPLSVLKILIQSMMAVKPILVWDTSSVCRIIGNYLNRLSGCNCKYI